MYPHQSFTEFRNELAETGTVRMKMKKCNENFLSTRGFPNLLHGAG